MPTPRFLSAAASIAVRGAEALLRSSRSSGQRRRSGSGPVGSSVRSATAPRTSADGVLDGVSYVPHRDGEPDPGEVVWAWVPYEDDPAQGKDRPALAIGYDGPLLVVVPLTSQDQHGRPDTFRLGSGPWDSTGRPSWVKLDRLIAVAPAAVRREGATLDRPRFDDVVARLENIHGSPLRLTR